MSKKLSIQEYEELSEAVRGYPCLYDKSKKEYKDKNVTENAWKEVAKCLSFIEKGKFCYYLCGCHSLYNNLINWVRKIFSVWMFFGAELNAYQFLYY